MAVSPSLCDDWPLYVDTEYVEDGPAVLCGGWRLRPRLHSSSVPLMCGMAIHGSTLAEFRASLQQHLRSVSHCEEPLPYAWRPAGKTRT